MTTLTDVKLLHDEGRTEHWIRFGRYAEEHILDRRRRVLRFPAASIFAFVRWASNGYGTVLSRIDILRAVDDGEPFSTIPFVRPGGEVLLRISGWPKVERVHHAIDAVEALGIDATDASPEHWRHVGNRLAAGEEPRLYTLEAHRAWLARRRLQP